MPVIITLKNNKKYRHGWFSPWLCTKLACPQIIIGVAGVSPTDAILNFSLNELGKSAGKKMPAISPFTDFGYDKRVKMIKVNGVVQL